MDHVVDASKSENFNLDQFIANQRRAVGNRSSLEPFCILVNAAGSFQPPEQFRYKYAYQEYPKVIQTPSGPVVVADEVEHAVVDEAIALASGNATQVADIGAGNADKPEAGDERATLIEALRAAGKDVSKLGNATIDTLRKRVADIGAGG